MNSRPIKLRRQLSRSTALLLAMLFAVNACAFPFASVLGKAGKSVGKQGVSPSSMGRLGGLANNQRYHEVRTVVEGIARDKILNDTVKSLEDLVRKVDSELTRIQYEEGYRQFSLSEDSFLILEQGVSVGFIRDSVRELAKRHGIISKRKGVGAKPHPAREEALELLRYFKREGLPRYRAIIRLERFYDSSRLPYTVPSHTSVKRWAAEVYR